VPEVTTGEDLPGSSNRFVGCATGVPSSAVITGDPYVAPLRLQGDATAPDRAFGWLVVADDDAFVRTPAVGPLMRI